LEGLIGAGKSTLVDKIKHSDQRIEVLREEINPMLLELFYSNPGKYGFAMQWAALQQRIYQSKLLTIAKDNCGTSSDCLWDRSMLGDYAFALWNHLTGNLNRAEMDAYESMFGASISDHPESLRDTYFVSHVDTYFWLVDDPMRCKGRVELRRSNPAEQGIPETYYQGLEDVHIFLFLKLLLDPQVSHKVKVRRWEQYQHVTDLEQLYAPGVNEVPSLVTSDLSGVVNGVYYNLILHANKSRAGVKQDVVDKYGFYFLDDASKAALYHYLSNGGDPLTIGMNIHTE